MQKSDLTSLILMRDTLLQSLSLDYDSSQSSARQFYVDDDILNRIDSLDSQILECVKHYGLFADTSLHRKNRMEC